MTKQFASAALRTDRYSHVPVHLVRTRDKSGERCYFLLRATQANYRRMLACDKNVSIDEFGEVLLSGFGSPSLAVRQRVKTEWNLDLPENF